MTLNKTPKIQLEIGEVTGLLKCDNLAAGEITIRQTCERCVTISRMRSTMWALEF